MRLQPLGHGGGVPVGEQGQGPPTGEIQQERAVGMTSVQGEIIHAEDLWREHGRPGGAADHAQQRVPTPPKASLPAEPHPGRPTEGQADGEQVSRQSPGASCPGCREAGQAFRKDAARAEEVMAEELPDAEPPGDLVSTPREIGERPGVITMHMACRDIAPRASDCHPCRRDQQSDLSMHVVEVPGVQAERDDLT
jgi:hypothetical protein